MLDGAFTTHDVNNLSLTACGNGLICLVVKVCVVNK